MVEHYKPLIESQRSETQALQTPSDKIERVIELAAYEGDE